MNNLEINNQEKNYCLSTIETNCSHIEDNPEGSDNIEYFFNILCEMGYLLMYGFTPEQDSKMLNRVEKLFDVIDENETIFSPSCIDFISLEIELEWYSKLWTEHKDFIKKFPTLKEHSLVEDAWEKVFNDMKQRGIELIDAGLDMFAVLYSKQILFADIQGSIGWQKSWNKFFKRSLDFFKDLISTNKEYFLNVSDSAYQLISKFVKIKSIDYHSDVDLINFIRCISQPHKSYAADSAYRKVISPEEAEEIYFNISYDYQDRESQGLSKIYLYECALAEKVLKLFIMKKCFAMEAFDQISMKSISDWQLFSNSDDDDNFHSVLPMIIAGNQKYAICIIPSNLTGFSIRNDLFEQFKPQLNGVLFCSFKTYPSDEILVRFDSFVEKNRVAELINNTEAVEEVQNVTKLSFDEIYESDKRNDFLEEAARAVAGIQEEEATEAIEALMVLEFYQNLQMQEQIKKHFQYLVQTSVVSALWLKQKYTPKKLKGQMSPNAAKEPETNMLHIPCNVSNIIDEKIVLLPGKRDNVVTNMGGKLKKYISIYDFITNQSDWHYSAYAIDKHGKTISDSAMKGSIKGNKKINYNVKESTHVIFLCLGTEETIKNISVVEKIQEIPKTKDENFIWLIYGDSQNS